MNSQNLQQHTAENLHRLSKDLAADLKAEASHIADPAQCGIIVRHHFDGIVFALYTFILVFLAVAVTALWLYARHG